ncbi:MAG: MerR family transcriptional regulator, partial [Treponema sp.]|nr:MerR family transcriptional regulator [Treponema sp.]
MLKIGEVAKQFNISNRTLRYWEEAGILESSRLENGYRFYDNENANRIRQIVMLRRLRMPIADIERI